MAEQYNSAYTGAEIDAAIAAVTQKEASWDDGVTKANAALPKSGGTMTGSIIIGSKDTTEWKGVDAYRKTSVGGRDAGFFVNSGGESKFVNRSISSAGATSDLAAILFDAEKLQYVVGDSYSGTDTVYDIYHTGNRPRPTCVSVVLSSGGWTADGTGVAQTVAVQGVSASETAQLILPTPALASQAAYMEAGIVCTGQAENSLTFTASEEPTADLTVYVTIQEVNFG